MVDAERHRGLLSSLCTFVSLYHSTVAGELWSKLWMYREEELYVKRHSVIPSHVTW